MAYKKVFIFSLFFIQTLVIIAQKPVKPLLLEDALRVAMEQNKQIKLAINDQKIAEAQFKQTEAVFLPQINLSYSGLLTNQPLSAFGFKMQQAQVQQSDFNPTILNNPGSVSNTLTQLSVQQPIYNADLGYMRKAALKQTAVYAFQVQRSKEAIEMQVTNAYLQLSFNYDLVNVLHEALNTVKEIYRFTNDRYQQGLLQKSDLLNVEVQIKSAETNLAEAQTQIKNNSNILSQLMGTTLGEVYSTSPVIFQLPKILEETVSANRSDIKAMITAIDAYDLAIKSTKHSMFPKLNGFANYQLNDAKLFGFGANGYMAGVQLSWDIFKGNQAKNKIATQVLEKNKLQEQLNDQTAKSDLEIRKTIAQLADTKFKIEQQSIAVEQASEALRILQNRYSQGLANTTDVLMAQSQLSQQKMLKAQAIFIQNTTINYLKFLTANQ